MLTVEQAHQIKSKIPITNFRLAPYTFLSNFYVCRIEWQSRMYKTVEHLYQASKAKSTQDHEKIRLARTAGDAKALGQVVSCRADWESIKVEVMRNALMLKFASDVFAEKLPATGDCLIVEGNYWHDNFWGDCGCKKCEHIKGLNVLGGLLMELRYKLQGR